MARRSGTAALLLCVVLAGCGNSSVEKPEPSASSTEPLVNAPPSSTTVATSIATTTLPIVTTTLAVTTTVEPVVLIVLPAGDAEAGEELFNMPMAVRLNDSCEICHSTTGEAQRWGNVLDGIADVAGNRVEGLTGAEYLQQAIVAPRAHIVDGFQPHMPENYRDVLSDQDLADLIAFLLQG